eukprot:Rmarinus@m.11939
MAASTAAADKHDVSKMSEEDRKKIYEDALEATGVLTDHLVVCGNEKHVLDPSNAMRKSLTDRLRQLDDDTSSEWRAASVDDDGVNTKEEVGKNRPEPEDLLRMYVRDGLHCPFLDADDYDEDTFGEEALKYRAREADFDGINSKEEVGDMCLEPAEWLKFYIKKCEDDEMKLRRIEKEKRKAQRRLNKKRLRKKEKERGKAFLFEQKRKLSLLPEADTDTADATSSPNVHPGATSDIPVDVWAEAWNRYQITGTPLDGSDSSSDEETDGEAERAAMELIRKFPGGRQGVEYCMQLLDSIVEKRDRQLKMAMEECSTSS